MNGINNQLINPIVAQNLGVFQEPEGSADEFEDLFPSFQDGQEIWDFPLYQDEVEVPHPQEIQDVNVAKSTSQEFEDFFSFSQHGQEIQDFPLHQDAVEVTHPQETQDINAAKSPSQKFIPTRKWTREEKKQFIELKQQNPHLPWRGFAEKYFPEHTDLQCKTQWNRVLAPLLKEGKQIDLEVQQKWTEEKNKQFFELKQQPIEQKWAEWTKEQNKRFFELKKQYPVLPWKDFAKYFPGYTDVQCCSHWKHVLAPLLEGRKLIDVEVQQIDLTPKNQKLWTKEESKRFFELKQQQPKLPWKEFAKHFPGKTSEQCSGHWHRIVELGSNKTWTKDEDEQLIKIKQQYPNLRWKNVAKHFPGSTSEQCKNHWNKILAPLLYQEGKLREGKLIDPKAKKIDPMAELLKWTSGKNKQFIELKKQQPKLPREDVNSPLIKKRKLTGEENSDNPSSKRSRIGLPSPAIPGQFATVPILEIQTSNQKT